MDQAPLTARPLEQTLYEVKKTIVGQDDIQAAQQLLGHTSVATTQRYVLKSQDKLRAAAMLAGIRSATSRPVTAPSIDLRESPASTASPSAPKRSSSRSKA